MINQKLLWSQHVPQSIFREYPYAVFFSSFTVQYDLQKKSIDVVPPHSTAFILLNEMNHSDFFKIKHWDDVFILLFNSICDSLDQFICKVH